MHSNAPRNLGQREESSMEGSAESPSRNAEAALAPPDVSITIQAICEKFNVRFHRGYSRCAQRGIGPWSDCLIRRWTVGRKSGTLPAPAACGNDSMSAGNFYSLSARGMRTQQWGNPFEKARIEKAVGRPVTADAAHSSVRTSAQSTLHSWLR